ncbi:polysaccharide deacetylase family protein [Marinomonas ostreistagni]|uniref:polysaccharide deacetylase family protein n=1 Tax=Marinomonas ostreistagni TaxID=359209 RepID=UPI0019522A22|nr:polysaccharide deacetylase family protein [Marinomonas ostreistagni]MBM6552171.1 polysaccharide deacetylase family protein [Marinomonas ostreistagni]
MSSFKQISWLCVALGVSGTTVAQDYLPILQYHHVDANTPRSTSVSPEEFRQHMDYLKEANFEVVDLAQALKDIKAGVALPEKAVAITFDDAYRNIYSNGFDVLKAHDFPFTVFINTGPVEQGHSSFLTWAQMQEMQQSGAVFANHTVSHPYMLRLLEGETLEQWQARMEKEVSSVETLLNEKLGQSPNMLAYPYGESNELLRERMAEQGMIAFGQQSGVVSKDSDFTNLPRFPAAGNYAKLSTLKVKLNAQPMPLASFSDGGDFASGEPVSMTLNFKEGNYRLKDLACYVSGQGKATLDWPEVNVVEVHAEQAFPVGRGRINCTMPDVTGQQYYWFSNVWITPGDDQRYVTEKIKKN